MSSKTRTVSKTRTIVHAAKHRGSVATDREEIACYMAWRDSFEDVMQGIDEPYLTRVASLFDSEDAKWHEIRCYAASRFGISIRETPATRMEALHDGASFYAAKHKRYPF